MAVAEPRPKWLQRMVVMVDIHHLRNPKSFAVAIQQCVQKLLASCDSKTLWAFKLFDSSLSSYRSRSAIEQYVGKWAGHVSFDSVHQVQTFTSALKCLAKLAGSGSTNLANFSKSGGGYGVESVAQAMQELINDYCWEPLIYDEIVTPGRQNMLVDRNGSSNLVVLFSSLPWTREEFVEFFRDGKSCTYFTQLTDGDLTEKFTSKFRSVNESFKSRHIQFCWVDVPPIVFQENNPSYEMVSREVFFESFRRMGWSFSSVDTLILAAKLVPFSLIWPTIANPRVSKLQYSTYADVHLEMEDIDGRALMCKACEVQWIYLNQARDLNASGRVLGLDFNAVSQKNSGKRLSSEISGYMKINVVLPFPKDKCMGLMDFVSGRVLLSGFKGRKKKSKLEIVNEGIQGGGNALKEQMDMDFIGDELLSRLQQQEGEFRPGKPAWQLLLVFLSHHNFLSLVNVSDDTGYSFGCILEPLTVHTAILHVLGADFLFTANMATEGGCHLQICSKILEVDVQTNPNIQGQVDANTRAAQEGREIEGRSPNKQLFLYEQGGSEMKVDTPNKQSFPNEQGSIRSSLDCSDAKKLTISIRNTNGRGDKSSKRHLDIQCNTWESFYSAIVGGSFKKLPNPVLATMLEDRFFKGSCKQSKKLKFLSRWMKKFSKKKAAGENFEITFNQPVLNSQTADIHKVTSNLVLETISQPALEYEQSCPLSSDLPSNSNASLSTEVGDCDSAPVELDCAESFTYTLDEKIQHSLSDKEVDLKAFAKRLLDDILQHINVEVDAGYCSSAHVEKARKLMSSIYNKVTKLILKKPKELAIKYKDCRLPLSGSQLSDSVNSSVHSSEDKVREHELQVLFRMEILSSKIAESIEDYEKDKLIKEICKLLGNIQFNLPGGIFHGESLNEFADRVIASRYDDRLDIVINKIYKEMEFYAHDESREIFSSASNQDKDSEMQNDNDAEVSSQNEFIATDSGEGRNSVLRKQSDAQVSCAGDERIYQKFPDHSMLKLCSEKYLKGDDYQRRLKKAEAKRERARRFAHFTSRAGDLQRVWAPKQPSNIFKKQCKSHVKQCKSHVNQLRKHVKVEGADVIYETPMRSSKARNYKYGKTAMIGRKETKTAFDIVQETPYPTKGKDHGLGIMSDVVRETPYPIIKTQNHESRAKITRFDSPNSRIVSRNVTSGMDSKLGSISRVLFETGENL